MRFGIRTSSSSRLALFATPFFVLGCSQGGVTAPSTDAAASSGGATGTGGTTSGTGGATSTASGGTTGTGGVSATGGSTGTGGDTGSGGSSATGGAGGATSVGGSVGTGGARTGGATGNGGTNAGGSTGAITVQTFAGIPNSFGSSLMDSFFMVPCYSQMNQDCGTIPTGATCANPNAPNFEDRGITQTQHFAVGGTPGVMYNMTFTANGITEPKYYMGGTRDAGLLDPPMPDLATGIDTFYRGGAPVAQEFYNVYKLIVRNPGTGTTPGTELAHYYMNSMPQANVSYENHRTFPISFTKTIPVPGGGSVDYFIGDSNCRAIDNCGAGTRSTTCTVTAGRNVPNEPGLVIPTMYMGQQVSQFNTLNGATQPYHAQILHVRVTAVVPM